MNVEQALSLIRTIPDYPKPGILFQDITPVLSNPEAFNVVVRALAQVDPKSSVVAGIEARGFIFASAIAVAKNCGFVPIRKKGKLPFSTYSKQYGLEYGVDEIEIHTDAFEPGSKVLLVDDVLATGGTLVAAIEAALPRPKVEINTVIPFTRGDLVSAIHERGEIFSEEYLPQGTSIHALVDGSLAKVIENLK